MTCPTKNLLKLSDKPNTVRCRFKPEHEMKTKHRSHTEISRANMNSLECVHQLEVCQISQNGKTTTRKLKTFIILVRVFTFTGHLPIKSNDS